MAFGTENEEKGTSTQHATGRVCCCAALLLSVGVITGFLAACGWAFADSKLLDCYPAAQILLKIASIILGAIAVFALTGQITFSGK
jgi:hypothetical protein